MKTNPTSKIDLTLPAMLVAIALGIFALFQLPGLFGESIPQTEDVLANRSRMEQMSATERKRIKRRADKFAEMSEPRRAGLRKLHSDLQTASDSERLKTVLKRYNAWLATLHLFERDELRKELGTAKTPAEQRAVVEQLKKKKDDKRFVQSLDRRLRFDYSREKDPKKKAEMLERFRETYRYGQRRRRGPRLQTEELDEVVGVIADQLQLSETQMVEWGQLSRSHRRLKVMIAALTEHSQRLDDGEQGFLRDSDLRQPIEQGIKDAELRKRLLTISEPWQRRFYFTRHYYVLYLIKNSIASERSKERGNPSDEQLSQFFQSLNPEQMEQLTQKSVREQVPLLKKWYFLSGGEDGEDFSTFLSEWYSLFRRYGFRSPRGGSFKRKGSSRRGRSSERSIKPKSR